MKNNIGKLVALGLIWEGGTKTAVQIISWVSTIYVANLLSPEDYAYILISGIICSPAMILSNLGIPSVVINRKEIKKELLNSLYWLLLLTASAAYAFIFLISGYIEDFYQLPGLADAIKISGIMVLVSNVKAIPYSLLLKRLSFKYVATTDMVSKFIQIILSIVMATYGMGYFSLLVPTILSQVVLMYMHLVGAQFGLRVVTFGREGVWGVLKTSYRYLLIGLSRNVNDAAPAFLVSIFLSAYQSGLFQMAYTIAAIPLVKIGEIFDRIAFPAISSIKDEVEKRKIVYLSLHKAILSITAPMFLGLYLVSEDLVALLLDDKWSGIAPIIKVLCLISLLKLSMQLMPKIIEGIGKPTQSLVYQIILGLTVVIGMLIGSNISQMGLYFGWLLVLPISYIYLLNVIKKFMGVTLRETILSFAPSVVSVSFMVFCVQMSSLVVDYYEISGLLVLIIRIVVGVVSYLLIYLFLFKSDVMALYVLLVKDFEGDNKHLPSK